MSITIKRINFLLKLFICLSCWTATNGVPLKFDGVNKSRVSPKEMEKQENDILPPKHLDAVKIGPDGVFNKEFHQEVFLGEEISDFQDSEEAEQKIQLKKIFFLIDENRDEQIDEGELAEWVLKKTIEHFNEAKNENKIKFNLLDINNDSMLDWNEFLMGFFSNKGLKKSDTSMKKIIEEEIQLSAAVRDQIEEARDKWIQASSNRSASPLSLDQFLFFQHPETSQRMIEFMVEDLLHDIDMDGNGEVSIQEFLMLEGEDSLYNEPQNGWVRERRKEFMNVLDKNNDGIASKDELEAYVNPLNKAMPHQEARQLIGFGDDNGDGVLSLQELLINSEYYTGSKLYNYAKNIHYDL